MMNESTRQSRTRYFALWVLTPILLLVGAVRMFGVVLEDPMHGYANQYDMLKIQACFGLWQRGQTVVDYKFSPGTPVAEFEFGEPSPENCLPQTGLLTTAPAVVYAKVSQFVTGETNGSFPVRIQGVTMALWYCLFVLALTWIMRSRPKAVVFNALVFAAVLADPFNTLWFNGFYSEAVAILFAYVSTALLLWHLTNESTGRGLQLLFLLSLFLFGFSKIQHMLFPALFALIIFLDATFWKRRRQRAFILATALVAVAVISIQSTIVGNRWTFTASTTSDMLLGAVLPAAPDPQQALKSLGLPARCQQVIGKTWFDGKAEEIKQGCPEAFTFSRLKLLPLLIREPVILQTVFGYALPQAKLWVLDNYLGVIAGREYGKFQADSALHFTIATYVKKLGDTAWLLVYAAVFIVLLAALAIVWKRLRARNAQRENAASLPWLPLLCSATVIGITLIAIFGNGYSEVARHAHLSFSFLFVLVLWLLCYVALGMRRRLQLRVV